MLLFKSVFTMIAPASRKLLLLPILIGLGSCGFTPVYSQKGENADISAKLASVEIKPIKTLIGQQYVNELEDVLDPSHLRPAKEYVMQADVNKTVLPLAIEQDRTVTRYKVTVTATYKITEIASGKIISQGSIKNAADYDRVESDYATYVSENDTANRAIRELAQDTKVKIISALMK